MLLKLNYFTKSSRNVPPEQIKSVLSEECVESSEQTYDIYLLPPGEDSETCQSYLRMRNKDGKYNLMFEVCYSFYTLVKTLGNINSFNL